MADATEYISRPDELGNIHISEEVLAVIAAAATLEVEGVGSLSANLGTDLAELLGKRTWRKGSILPSRKRASGWMSPFSSSMVIPSSMWPKRFRIAYITPSRTPAA